MGEAMPLSRIEFLSRVRKGLRAWKGEAQPKPSQEQYSRASLGDQAGSLTEKFISSATNAGMVVYEAGGDWGERLGSLLQEKGCRQILTDAGEILRSAPSWERLEADFEWIDWSACGDPLEASFQADCGITGVDFAVAETGSLVILSSADRSRLATLVVPIHIALVQKDQILAGLMELFSAVSVRFGTSPPSQMVFITGPSKTSDIEMVLVKGVHGPLEVHILLI